MNSVINWIVIFVRGNMFGIGDGEFFIRYIEFEVFMRYLNWDV